MISGGKLYIVVKMQVPFPIGNYKKILLIYFEKFTTYVTKNQEFLFSLID